MPARDALVARWFALTRTALPAVAATRRWPIRADHCFMRVCLDAALGVPWTATVKRPALRSMNDAELAAAVEIAEGIAARPDTLRGLNAASIEGRRAARQDSGKDR